MIRAMMQGKSGRPVIILGFDAENIRRLQAGEPIYLDGAAHGMGAPADVIIIVGDTYGDVVRQLQEAGVELPLPDA